MKKKRTRPATALPMTHSAIHERDVTVPEKRHPQQHPCAVRQGLSAAATLPHGSTTLSAGCGKPGSQCAEGLRRQYV